MVDGGPCSWAGMLGRKHIVLVAASRRRQLRCHRSHHGGSLRGHPPSPLSNFTSNRTRGAVCSLANLPERGVPPEAALSSQLLVSAAPCIKRFLLPLSILCVLHFAGPPTCCSSTVRLFAVRAPSRCSGRF